MFCLFGLFVQWDFVWVFVVVVFILFCGVFCGLLLFGLFDREASKWSLKESKE